MLKKKNMKTTTRFDNAIQKLYQAFNNDTLHPEYCHRCAVGNILDNIDSWQHLTDHHGSGKLNYVGLVNQNFGKRFGGYTPLELLEIEITFLKACGYQLPLKPKAAKPSNPKDKDLLFQGLCAVITYPCKLDGILNVMAYQDIFKKRLVQKNTSVSAHA
jgi:hypothetical protein